VAHAGDGDFRASLSPLEWNQHLASGKTGEEFSNRSAQAKDLPFFSLACPPAAMPGLKQAFDSYQ
jgi:hypothetical protein